MSADIVSDAIEKLSERVVNVLQDRLRWLDHEITRYRDYEWKATSFHAVFFVALLYILIDEQRRLYILEYKGWLFTAVIIYLVIAIYNIVYIHRRLNKRRNEKSGILRSLGFVDIPKKISFFFCLYEGPGAIIPLGFIISLILLGTTVLLLL